ncbi:MAG: aspartate--tRNA ligase [Bacteroidia bacterium]
MLRTHTCGELRLTDSGNTVSLCGWVSKIRDKGGMLWVDLRDRYGITQLMAEEGKADPKLLETLRSLGREYVICARGKVVERYAKNDKMATGDIEIMLESVEILNPAKLPPFLIEDETDGGEDLRMKYRYLDLRRNPIRAKLALRHKVAQSVRRYLDAQGFLEVETPVLIKSTPEGARDFVVPSRMHPGEFYALPQSPQTFKQLLMVGGFDRYFQIVKCFRDEDLRADRQPEFTQIDCEMAFVEREDILSTFEGMIRSLFMEVKGIDIGEIARMSYDEAMQRFGNDKPDARFGMELVHLKGYDQELTAGKNFVVFDSSEAVIGIPVAGGANYTRKQLDELTEWVKRPQLGMKGMVWMRYEADGSLKSSVDKFYGPDELSSWAQHAGLKSGDLLLVLAGEKTATLKAASELRLELANRLGLRKADEFKALWVLDFPLLERDADNNRWMAMHHPFTSPRPEDLDKLNSDPGSIKANAYDMVLNGNEIGGGSIRIHDRQLQAKMFEVLGFTSEEAQEKFGFLLNAFEYGAPPHGGIAFGFDRLCALFGGSESIRDFIAFPKNNAGRDVMIDAPGPIDPQQWAELALQKG